MDFLVTDFEKVCRICMKFNKNFLSITSFNIIDMIIACTSVQIWENDDLPNQICHDCFLQLQNTTHFKELCQNSDKAFRQIIKKNKINLSNNQNDFNNVKDEEFEDYTDNNSPIDIKEEDFHQNVTNENILENIKFGIGHNEDDDFKKSETNTLLEIKNKDISESKKMQIRSQSENESNTCEDIQGGENDIGTFKCEKCNKEFKKLWLLGTHMHQTHRVKALKCNECKRKYYHPLHLKQHQELAHNPMIRTCIACNKLFANIYKLRNHKCRHLSKSLQCQGCDKLFKDKQELKRHNKEVHSYKEKYVTCHICGKSYSKKNIKIHLVIHEEREKITCDICSKTFLREISLVNHIKQVHENQKPARNHLCSICGHALRTSFELRMHLLKHANERPYACDQCDKTYRRPDNLRDHKAHTHLNQRKYKCRFCSNAFYYNRQLVHHERRHTGEKPHKCEVCDKRFIQRVALTIHMRTHTKTTDNVIQS